MSRLRRRIERSETLAGLVGRLAAGYLRLCLRTIRWTEEGFGELRQAMAEGPVIVALWHSRILLGPAFLAPCGRVMSIGDPSPAGRVGGVVQARFGLHPVRMASGVSNRAASREVLRRLREGQSAALAADGPLGPAHEANAAPLDWARVAGATVFLFAFATTRQRRLDTWDRMLVPRPFGRGHARVARWEVDLPRRADAETLEALRRRLAEDLNAHQAETDAALGLSPGA